MFFFVNSMIFLVVVILIVWTVGFLLFYRRYGRIGSTYNGPNNHNTRQIAPLVSRREASSLHDEESGMRPHNQ